MALFVTLFLLINSSNFSFLLNQKISYRKFDESFLQYGTPQVLCILKWQYKANIMDDSTTLRELIFAKFFSGKKKFARINFREATESIYFARINFRESKIPKKEKSFSHIESLF